MIVEDTVQGRRRICRFLERSSRRLRRKRVKLSISRISRRIHSIQARLRAEPERLDLRALLATNGKLLNARRLELEQM